MCPVNNDKARRTPLNGGRIRHATAMACLLVMMSLALAPAPAAEPSSSVRYLMKEPASMLDLGLLRLDEQLHRNRGVLAKSEDNLFEPEPSIRVNYAWADNRIEIFIKLTMDAHVKNTPQRMAAIRSHVEFVATYLRGMLTMLPYDVLFRHRGFRSREFPENLDRELVEMTDIHLTVRDNQQNILSTCKASLAAKEIIWYNIGGS